MLKGSKRRKLLQHYADNHLNKNAHDPLAVKTTRFVNGVGYQVYAAPLSQEELRQQLNNTLNGTGSSHSLNLIQAESEDLDEDITIEDKFPNPYGFSVSSWVSDMEPHLEDTFNEEEPFPV